MKPLGFTRFVEHLPGAARKNIELPSGFHNTEKTAGVIERHVATGRETTHEMFQQVISKLLKRLNIGSKDCAGMIIGTSGDVSATELHTICRSLKDEFDMVGKTRRALHFACSTFTRMVQEAHELPNPDGKHIILATADDMLSFLDCSDSKTCSPFGSGAAATTLVPGGDWPVLKAFAQDFSDRGDHLTVHEKDMSQTIDGEWETNRRVLFMHGKGLMQLAPPMMVSDVRQSLEDLRIPLCDLSGIVPHRASLPILNRVREILSKDYLRDIPVFDELASGGNTGASTIPMTLARVQNTLQPGIYAAPAVGGGPYFQHQRGKLTHGCVTFEVR